MNDFFDQIKDNLEHRQEVPFEEASWTKLQEKIRPQEIKGATSNSSYLWIPITLLLLTMLGSNLFYFVKYNQLTEKLTSIELAKDATPIVNHIYHKDTVYITKYIQTPSKIINTKNQKINTVQTDYERSSKWEKTIAQSSNLLRAYSPSLQNGGFVKATSLLNELVGTKNRRSNYYTIVQQFAADDQESQKEKLRHFATLDYLYTNHFAQSNGHTSMGFSLFTQNNSTKNYRLNLRQRLLLMSRKFTSPKLSLGLIGGLGLINNKELEHVFSYNYGLESQFNFSDNFGFWASINYEQLSYQTSDYNENIGVPMIEPMDDEDVFDEASVKSNTLIYQAGFQYLFKNNSKFTPLFGLGFGSGNRIKNTIVYSFSTEENNGGGGGNEEHEDVEITIKNNSRQNLNGFLSLKTGLNYQLSNQFNLNLTGSYRLSTQKEDPIYNNFLNLNLGVFYKL